MNIPAESYAYNIIIVSSSSTSTVSGLLHSLSSFTVGSGDDRLLVVGITLTGAVLPDITSVTFGDQTLTQEITEVRGLVRVSIYSLVNPDVETNDIQVNANLVSVATIGAVYLTNVDTSNPITASNSATGVSSSPSVSITTTYPDTLLLDTLGTAPVVVPLVDSSQTEQWALNVLPTTLTGAGSTKLISTPSLTSMDWDMELLSIPVSQGWVLATVAIKENTLDFPDSIFITDTVDTFTSFTKTPHDSIFITDTVETQLFKTRVLSDSLSISEIVGLKGSFLLTARSADTTLQGGATYLITPSPTNGTDTLTISDNDGNDSIPISGIIGTNDVSFDDYFVDMIVVPTGYDVTAKATTMSIWDADITPLIEFSLIDELADVSNLDPIIVTTAPILNSTHTSTLSGFNTVIVNQTENVLDSTDDLPEIISVGKNNISGISSTIKNQVNLKLVTNIIPGTTGKTIQNFFGLPTYVMPPNNNLVTILPSLVIQDASNQIITIPPFNNISPGQRMIIPIQDSLLPSFGGVSKIDITSKSTATSFGTFDNDWIVIEIDDQHVNSPTLISSGITNELELEIDVKYRYEEDGVGFNWGDTNNYESDPTLTLFIQKPTSSEIIILANGCADVEIHTLIGDTWISGMDRILSNIPSVTNNSFCEVEVESDHYSKKSISSKSSSLSGFNSGVGSSNNGDSRRIGVDTGQTIMLNQSFDNSTNHLSERSFPQWLKFVMQWWIDEEISNAEITNVVGYITQNSLLPNNENEIILNLEQQESVKIIIKMWIEDKISDSALSNLVSKILILSSGNN